MLVQQILDRLTFVQAVVFSNSQTEVDALADALKGHFSALPLHSGLDLSERVGNLKKFKTGQARVLVTTDVFGRGMDLRSITLVVNAGLPRTQEQFVHRSGRTGRFGREGTVVSLDPDGVVEKWCAQEGWSCTVI